MSDTVTVKPISRREEPPARRGAGRLKIIIICGVAALLLIAAGVLFYAVQIYDKIYPGVTVRGTDLSGMTESQAAEAIAPLLAAEIGDKVLSVTIGTATADIPLSDIGVSLSAADIARAAYETGRTGGFFARAGFVLSLLGGNNYSEVEAQYYIDRAAVEQAVAELAAPMQIPLRQFSWDITETAINVTAACAGSSVDEAAVTAAIIERFERADFAPLSFDVQSSQPDPLPLDALHAEIYIEPKSAYLDYDADGEFAVMPHADGRTFSMELANRLAAGDSDFTLPLLALSPEITQQMLAASLFSDVLSEFSTYTYTSTQNRADNITLTAQAINNYIMMPGDVFSFNGVVGNRTEEKGYKMAGSYVNGIYVEQIGGGICQTSSTLYNSVLLANLEIVYRQNHSLTIGYVPLGQDATVNWNNIDIKFANNTGYPIMLKATHEKRVLTISILGTKTDDTTVTIENAVLSQTPYTSETVVNPELLPGTSKVKADGHNGYVVQTYRVIRAADGSVISRTPEAKSVYRVITEIIEVGPEPTDRKSTRLNSSH